MINFKLPESSNEDLREAAAFLGDLITAIVKTDSNTDGKVTFLEVLWSLGNLTWKHRNMGISFKKLYFSWKAATREERKAVIDAFAEHFDLANDSVETFIEVIIEDIVSLISSTDNLIKVVKENKS